MKTKFGDLFTEPCDVLCITTNGDVKKNGRAVMGRGVALQAKQKWKGIDLDVGYNIESFGNHVMPFAMWPRGKKKIHLVSFPVKHHWRDKADLELIERSAIELAQWVRWYRASWVGANDWKVILPRPGCGNGGRTWEEVRPIIEPHLDDRFIVLNKQQRFSMESKTKKQSSKMVVRRKK